MDERPLQRHHADALVLSGIAAQSRVAPAASDDSRVPTFRTAGDPNHGGRQWPNQRGGNQ